MTWSRNSWSFSCWREVARIVSTPASGLAITEAASRNVMFGVETGAAGTAPGTGGGAAAAWGAPGAPDPGRILSVSRRMSFTFSTSVSQNLLLEVLRTVVLDALPAPAAAPAPPPPAAPVDEIWLETPTVPWVIRSML